jgi:hypothetical protein
MSNLSRYWSFRSCDFSRRSHELSVEEQEIPGTRMQMTGSLCGTEKKRKGSSAPLHYYNGK